MKNTIQVYGLPRSGTNFLEWSLVEYFEDLHYENKYEKCDVKGIVNYTKPTALKHCHPNLKHSDFVIVIYKEYDKWVKSYKKWSGKKAEKSVWETYLKKANEIDEKFCMIISHDTLYNKYENTLNDVSNKFNLKMIKDKKILKPTGIMNRGGANASPIKNITYKYE